MPSAAGPAPLRVELTADPEEFAARALPWLAQDPVTTNVIATVVRDARDGDLAAPDSIWVLVTSGGQVMGAGMHTPPYPVYLPPLPDGAAAAVAQTLLTAGRGVAGVSGGPAATIEFVDRWCARTGAQARLERAEAMHVLADLAEPQVSGGRPRRATARDAPLCEQWLVAFHAEAMPDRPPTDVSQPVAHMIRRGTLT